MAALRVMPKDAHVIAKRGPLGASGLGGGSMIHVPAPAVKAVDTIGAGDVFNAGFLAALARGEALRRRDRRRRGDRVARDLDPSARTMSRRRRRSRAYGEGSMSSLSIRGIKKRYRPGRGAEGHRHRAGERRVPGAAGIIRLRQVDLAQHHCRPDRPERGRAADRRSRHHRCASEGSRHRDGVPVVRALSEHDGRAQPDLRARDAQGRRQDARGGAEARRDVAADRASAGPQAGAIVRRPAPARRHRPRPGARAEGVPVRRAAVQSRCQAAGGDAHRDQEAAPAPRHHHRLCDARPDRGHDPGLAHRHHARRRGRSSSRRRRRSTSGRPTCMSPASSARRR